MKNKQNFAGFTLIELLVVIAVIGILATISVTAFNGYQKKSRDAKRQAELSQMAKIITTEYVINEKNCGKGNAHAARACVMSIIKEKGLTLPSADKDCYVYGFNMGKPDDFFIISSEQYLDKVLVFHGTSPVKNLFDPNGGTNDKFKGTNFYYMSLYIQSYKDSNCNRAGNAVNFYKEPDGETSSYFMTPLNPALQ